MAIVPNLSGVLPGNPTTSQWDGTDDHHPTTEELIQLAAAAEIAAGLFGAALQDTANQAEALALLGLPATPGDLITAAELTTALASYATSASVTTALASYLTIVSAAATYITDAELATGLATKPDLADAAPSDLAHDDVGVVGVSTQAAKEDHQHAFPKAVVNSQTGTTYTLQDSDHGKIVELTNAGAITLTVGTLFNGFNCGIAQGGAGQVSIAVSGVTLKNSSTHTKLRTNGSEGSIRISGSVAWFSGDTAA